MNIKHPPCYDISHWKLVPDFKAIFPRPLLMITKATQGTWYRDLTLKEYMQGMADAGYHRGVYHYNEKLEDGGDQAKYFLNYIAPYADDNTLLFLDVEQGGERASQLWEFLETVRAARPRNPLMIYSRKNILEAIPMTAAERVYFKGIPVWTAGYPENPDNFNSPPAMYIPDPSRFGPVCLWQYTDSGRVEGISGDVDCNWIAPNLQTLLHYTPPVQPPLTGGTMQYRVVWPDGARKRAAPTTTSAAYDVMSFSFVADVIQDGIPDQTYPTNTAMRWVKLADGKYAASDYPSGGVPQVRMAKVGWDPEPEPPAELPASIWMGATPETATWYDRRQ